MMVSGVGSMKVEGRELSHKMVRRTPHLYVWPVRHGDVSVQNKLSWKYVKKENWAKLTCHREKT